MREFIQNAIDQQETIADNKLDITYDELEEKLLISNKSSILEKNTLLLGNTTKNEDANTIGQFGEGYKVALLVLTRLNKPVIIYNYGARETWTCRFVKSRRFNDDVLTIFVDKEVIWSKVPDNNLTIEINNITKSEWNEVVERTLILQQDISKLESERGSILLNPKYKGKIFVNGLFISYQNTEYGYDIKPQYLNIGRDRNLVNNFDIVNQTSFMWRENDGELLKKLILNKCPDVEYLYTAYDVSSGYIANEEHKEQIHSIADNLYTTLKESVVSSDDEVLQFVESHREAEIVKKEYENVTPSIIDYSQLRLLKTSNLYQESMKNKKKRALLPADKFKIWSSKYSKYLTNIAKKS